MHTRILRYDEEYFLRNLRIKFSVKQKIREQWSKMNYVRPSTIHEDPRIDTKLTVVTYGVAILMLLGCVSLWVLVSVISVEIIFKIMNLSNMKRTLYNAPHKVLYQPRYLQLYSSLSIGYLILSWLMLGMMSITLYYYGYHGLASLYFVSHVGVYLIVFQIRTMMEYHLDSGENHEYPPN